MAVLFNGTNGSTIANEDGWTADTSGSGKYSTTYAHTGTASMTVPTGPGSWVKRSIGSNTHSGAYFRVGALPELGYGYDPPFIMLLWSLKSGYFHGWGIDYAGQFAKIVSNGSTGSYTLVGSAGDFPLNQWVRVEASYEASSTLKVFKSANLETTTHSLQFTGGPDLSSGNVDSGEMWAGPFQTEYDVGTGQSYGSAWANGLSVHMDDLQVGTTWPGPYVAPASTSYAGIVRI